MKRKLTLHLPTLAAVVLLALASLSGSTFLTTVGASSIQDRNDKVATDLRGRISTGGTDTVRIILQLNASATGRLNALLNRNGIHVKQAFNNFNASLVELPISVVDELASYDEVQFVTLDSQIVSMGHVSSTTGADDVRSQTSANGATYALDGSGIGIAVVDSGIYTAHKSIGSRVIYNQDFTGEGRIDDAFGHGTHVASAAAGNGSLYNGSYVGIAPNANLINLRVLNSAGVSTTSQVLAALNWIYSNRGSYNIRVVNLSLGAPAISSYKNDPLCLAVRKLSDAGLVVVAAAGNDGKDQFGRKQYGAIHAPGNEPSAITVGASNSFDTDSRADDVVTTYSSRGPTRSFWTDRSGVNHYDNLIKPDMVAPGNKIIFAESADNYLVGTHPELDTNLSPNKPTQRMMYLSGTSVSTPLVSGAAALLLQANPKLTPNMVKMILMYSAQQLPEMNMLEQGAGELNIEGAIRLAKLVRSDLKNTTALGSPLLTTTAPNPQSTIDGTTFSWSQGIVVDQGYLKGSALITKYQKIYGTGVLLSDATLYSNGVLLSDLTMVSSGVLLSDNIVISNGTVLGSGPNLLPAGVLLNDGVLLSDGVLIADGVLISDGVLLNDGVLLSDGVLIADRTK